MIVVDGDSVAMVTETGVPAAKKWPILLGQQRGLAVESLARQRATAKDCAMRVWRALARRPTWYVLMIGQWSQNHEAPEQFEKCVRAIVEEMLLRSVRVALVTPPVEVTDLMPYLRVLHKCAAIYRADVVDVHEHFRQEGAPAEWFEQEGTVPCHFSETGAQNVLKCFNRPETAHICVP